MNGRLPMTLMEGCPPVFVKIDGFVLAECIFLKFVSRVHGLSLACPWRAPGQFCRMYPGFTCFRNASLACVVCVRRVLGVCLASALTFLSNVSAFYPFLKVFLACVWRVA